MLNDEANNEFELIEDQILDLLYCVGLDRDFKQFDHRFSDSLTNKAKSVIRREDASDFDKNYDKFHKQTVAQAEKKARQQFLSNKFR